MGGAQQPGQLDHPGCMVTVEVAGLAVAVPDVLPVRLAQLADGGAGPGVQVEPDRVVHAAPVHAFNAVTWLIRSRVAPAPSTVISRSRRYGSGIWVIASSSTAMWSDAVLDPALPGRSRNARDSHVLSHHAVSG